ncbi:MAG: MCE family protein [Myxococcales bacterium]|nr:MCE family protein [Myxococcales bacterium]MCB9523584.1 MCE family protein [Myxococcales bacterium]
MRSIFTPFTVGLLVIGGLVGYLWMFGQIKGGIDEDGAGYKVSAVFKDVTGLAEKSRVVIAGINVGQIDRIELEGNQARVWLLVNTPLKSDAQIAKRSAGLLGEFYLELTPGYMGTPLKDGDEIKNVIYDASTSELMNEVQAITKNVKDITDALNRVVTVDGGEQKIKDILEDVRQSVAELNRAIGENGPKIDRMVDNVLSATKQAEQFTAEFRRDARVIMADARQVTSDAKAITGNVRELVGRNAPEVEGSFDGIKGAVGRLQGALDKLDGALTSTQSIAAKIDNGQGTLGKLVNDDRLVESVNELVDESGRFLRRLTRLQVVVAMRADWYVNQADAKTFFEVRLQPRPDKYYSLQLVDDPRGRSSFVRRVRTSSASDTDPLVSEQERVTEDRFRLSLQFAKRMWFFQGRIGIIESSGGVGMDFFLFDDALELSADVFDLDAAANPRVRAMGAVRFFTHLYITGGIDDVFNDDLRDWFIGAGVRFTDDDLVAIMAAAPTPSL